jgi:protein-tyrosine phosphatase
MVVLFPEPYNPKAVAVAAKHNMIIPNNSAKQLLNEDFGNDTLVLAMNSHMKQKIYDEYSEAINVYTLSEYAGEPEQDIKDPYGKGIEEYNACFEMICRLVGKVAEYLDGLSEEKEDKGEEQ